MTLPDTDELCPNPLPNIPILPERVSLFIFFIVNENLFPHLKQAH